MNESNSFPEQLIVDKIFPETDPPVHFQVVYDRHFRGVRIKVGSSNKIQGSGYAYTA